jgi:hypothetical protein
MAKRKVSEENLDDALLFDIHKATGGRAVSLDAAIDDLVGIPLERCLPMQYVMGVDAFPLNRQFSVIGPWGSTKSAFCDELGARFQRFGGRTVVQDVERKKNPIQAMAQFRWFLDWSDDMMVKLEGIKDKVPRTFMLLRPPTLEDMLKTLVAIMGKLSEHAAKNKDVRLPPHLLVVDSLFAGTNATDLDAIINKAADGNNISNLQNAAAIKKHIQAINSMVDQVPVSVIFINHMAPTETGGVQIVSAQDRGKQQGTPGGKYRAQEGGGRFKDFVYSGNFMLEPVTAGKSNEQWILGASRETPHIKIQLKKSCFGVQHDEPIVVPYRSIWVDDGKEDMQELIWYDWDASLTYILHRLVGPAELSRHFDLEYRNGCYSSKSLGLAGLSATEFGAAIHASPEVSRMIQRDVFHVQRIRKYVEDPDPRVALPLGRCSDGTWQAEERAARLAAAPEALDDAIESV